MKQWAESVLTLRTLIVVQIPSLPFSAEPTFVPSIEITHFKISGDLQHCQSQWLILNSHLTWPIRSRLHSCPLACIWNAFFTWSPEHRTLFPLSTFLPSVSSHSPLWVLISVSSAQKFLQFSDLFLIIISSLGQQFSSMLVSGLLYTLKINKKLKKFFVYEHDTYR